MSEMCYRCMQPTVVQGRCTACHCAKVERSSEDSQMLLPLGALLDEGNIMVGDKLGQGGFGITYIARDKKCGLIALKEFYPKEMVRRDGTRVVPLPGKSESYLRFYADFKREVKHLVRFSGQNRHPNIVRVLFTIEGENNTIYYGMELLRGESLSSYLSLRGIMPPVDAFRMLEPIMDALRHAHSLGTLHRDVAPDNIFLRVAEDKPFGVSPCLIDFGAAYSAAPEFTQRVPNVKKKGFSPPEQSSELSMQGPYIDVYSVAATYYYMITGLVPPTHVNRVTGEDKLIPPSQCQKNIPRSIDSVLLMGMELNFSKRIQNIQTLHDMLERALFASTPPPPPPQPPHLESSPETKPDRSRFRAAMSCLIEWGVMYGLAGLLTRMEMPDWLIIGFLLSSALSLISLYLGKPATVGQRLMRLYTDFEDGQQSFPHIVCYCVLRACFPLYMLDRLLDACLAGYSSLIDQVCHIRREIVDPLPPPPPPPPPTAIERPWLQCVSGTLSGRIFRLDSDETVLGRQKGVTIQIPDADAAVSRVHCQISLREKRWVIQDNGSHNGTFVNQTRLPKGTLLVLSDGAVIRVGGEEFIFHNHG